MGYFEASQQTGVKTELNCDSHMRVCKITMVIPHTSFKLKYTKIRKSF